jgi:hypothetical protein
MKDTARRADHQRKHRGPVRAGFAMQKIVTKHTNAVLNFDKGLFQAFCACGWSSSIDFFEAVDLLRAMHAHAVVTFGSYA